MIETIKDYLVSLGFQVDKQSYDATNNSIDAMGKGVEKFAIKVIGEFGKASLAVAGFVAAGAFGMAKFLDSLGDQQIKTEMLARQLWTTQQQAMAFNATLKATGATIQELYLSPTLMNQFRQLNAVALQMKTPADYQNEINLVQSVSLEMKQMRLESYYALQWIGYYFIKYMSGPITQVKNVLQSINLVILKNMPTWTKRVAEVMASFMQAGIYIVQALGNVYTWLQKMLSYMPGWVKGIVAALAGLAIVGASNPFFLFIEAIGAAILLLDDFETYLHGGKSAFAPFWAELEKISKYTGLMNIFKAAIEGVAVGFVAAKIAAGAYNTIMKVVTGIMAVFDAVVAADPIVWIIAAAIAVVAALAVGIYELVKHWSNVKKVGIDALTSISKVAETVWKAMETGFVNSINWIITQFDKVISLVDKIPGIKIPLIPLIKLTQMGATGSTNTNGSVGSYSSPTGTPYLYPRSTTNNQTSNQSVTINAPITNNVTGTGDPLSTANATTNATTGYLNNNVNRLIRSLRGNN